jgi:acyl-CoA synthetase (AMP-forming)/AMP-acid ligase II
VADEEGHPVRTGNAGECQIMRRGVFPHYWKDKGDEQGLLTPDGWLRTGDLATRNRLGMVRLGGRMKDVIKSGGYSVYARELEEALMAHPSVARAAAFGLPHREKGEIPVAAVELQIGVETSESDLVDWCRERLAPYKAPRRIWILNTGGIPQNHNGKVVRGALREMFILDKE